MSDLLSPEIHVTQDGDEIPSEEVLRTERHFLNATVDADNGDILLRFSSRIAMYDFARSILHEAIYGVGGQKEFYPLGFEGKVLVVDGVRLSLESSRIFVSYPDQDQHAE